MNIEDIRFRCFSLKSGMMINYFSTNKYKY